MAEKREESEDEHEQQPLQKQECSQRLGTVFLSQAFDPFLTGFWTVSNSWSQRSFYRLLLKDRHPVLEEIMKDLGHRNGLGKSAIDIEPAASRTGAIPNMTNRLLTRGQE